MNVKLRFLIAVLAVATLMGCKTNEKNYRAAYEKAVQHERAGIDSTIYEKIRREARPMETEVAGEKVGVMTVPVSVTVGFGHRQQLKRYSVVASQFRQLFNAKTMMNRLKGYGYDAFVVQTREPLYLVIAGSDDEQSMVMKVLDAISKDKRVVLKDPYPCLLDAARSIR